MQAKIITGTADYVKGNLEVTIELQAASEAEHDFLKRVLEVGAGESKDGVQPIDALVVYKDTAGILSLRVTKKVDAGPVPLDDNGKPDPLHRGYYKAEQTAPVEPPPPAPVTVLPSDDPDRNLPVDPPSAT